MSRHGSKNAHFASFLRAIWSVAGHAMGLRRQSEREKFKRSPNPRVGRPQLSTVRLVRGQYFEDWNPGPPRFSSPSFCKRKRTARAALEMFLRKLIVRPDGN